ncbi:MAG: NAD-dependent epimerase/dehydratase family protein [Burkholderiales bacterium]|nr:NAD-dependent epimerase/dehydratase family protein [Burkholderiales bacterium]
MKLLVLGGTRFLGRHVVDAALGRGDQVTLFTRGQAPNHWGDAVKALIGNRDPTVAPGLAALADGRWDAVIDTCGYVPRVVRASARLLEPRVGRYLFVSSISVFTDASCPGLDESAPVGALADPASEEVGKHYGPLKAACEVAVSEIYGTRALNIRPGLIVGPHDPTDRFGYWVARFVHPHLLGARGGTAVVPAPPSRPIQLIDARDLATFMLDLIASGASGTYNATSSARQWSFADLVAALVAAGGTNAPRLAWVDEATLVEHKVTPWAGLPLWIPSSFAEAAGFMEIDCTKAQRDGLRTRVLAATIADTAAWLAQRANANTWNDVLTSETEFAILAAAPERPPQQRPKSSERAR